jgi:hypothetical protein
MRERSKWPSFATTCLPARRQDEQTASVAPSVPNQYQGLRDAFEVEGKGVPIVTLASKPFVNAVRIGVDWLGIPGLPVFVPPYSIAALAVAELEAIADDLFGSVLSALVRT